MAVDSMKTARAVTSAAENALILTGDRDYLELPRSQIDMIASHGKWKGKTLQVVEGPGQTVPDLSPVDPAVGVRAGVGQRLVVISFGQGREGGLAAAVAPPVSMDWFTATRDSQGPAPVEPSHRSAF